MRWEQARKRWKGKESIENYRIIFQFKTNKQIKPLGDLLPGVRYY